MTLAAPGPAPTGVVATPAGPFSITISWTAATNAVGYMVMRGPSGNGPWTLVNAAPVSGTTLADPGVLPKSQVFYRVSAGYATMAAGTSEAVSVNTPPAPAPGSFTAVLGSDQRSAELSWAAPTGATGYFLWRDGSLVSTAPLRTTTYVDRALIPGPHTYRVAALYQPTGSQPMEGEASAPANLSVSRGRYRLSISRIRVNHESEDDPLQSDGKGDEVYLSVAVLEGGAKGLKMGPSRLVTSTQIGDTNGFSGVRIRGGTQSTSGGLRTGDEVPLSPPLLLWDSTLTDRIDAVLVAPTIWEYDGRGLRETKVHYEWLKVMQPHGARILTNWIRYQEPSDWASVFRTGPVKPQDLRQMLGVCACAISVRDADHWARTSDAMGGYNRPIGLNNEIHSPGFRPRAAVVTVPTAEASLAGGKGAIEIPIQYRDGVTGSGDYTIYVLLERVP